MSDSLVSVVMPNYGQEKFITEAILGVLSQKTNFEVELIVADDCSPDNTESVVKSIINDHPNGHWIKYIRHCENKGAIQNFVWTLQQAIGKYIAICEGDDYWIDPLKLQKQVDFLEKNHDYSLCFHRTDELHLNGEIKRSDYTCSEDLEKTFLLSDLLTGNFIHTPSVVFKNIFEIPEWIKESPIGDYLMWLLIAEQGKIKYLPRPMAIYRAGVGIWSSQSQQKSQLNWLKAKSIIISNTENIQIKESLQKSLYNNSVWFMKSIYPNYSSLINNHIYEHNSKLSFFTLLKMTIKKLFS